MRTLSRALLFAVGAINFVPVVGVLSAAQLSGLYGVSLDSLDDPSLIVLMRHRAVLLAIVGALLFGSLVRPNWRVPAISAAWLSMASFLLIAWTTPGVNDAVSRVALVDVVACALLAGEAIARRRIPVSAAAGA